MTGSSRYLGAVLAFAAALLGVAGPTRTQGESGLGAITWVGWTAVALAASALVLTVLQTARAASQLRAQQARLDAAQRAALDKLRGPLTVLLDSVVLAAFCAFGQKYPDSTSLRFQPAERLESDDVVARLRAWDVGRDRLGEQFRGPYDSGVPWGTEGGRIPNVIAEHARAAVAELGDFLGYAGYLSGELIDAATLVGGHRFARYLSAFPSEADKLRTIEDSDEYPFPFLNDYGLGGSEADYLDFVAALSRALALVAAGNEAPS